MTKDKDKKYLVLKYAPEINIIYKVLKDYQRLKKQ